MVKHDKFEPLNKPELPNRPPIQENFSEKQLQELTKRPFIGRSSRPGFVTVTVAVANSRKGFVPVFYIDALTHFHRGQLARYALDEYTPADGANTCRWHVGSFELPTGLTTMMGIIPAPTSLLQDANALELNRSAYKQLRQKIQPAWSDVETITAEGASLNAVLKFGETTQPAKPAVQQAPRTNKLMNERFDEHGDLPVRAWLHLPESASINHVLLVTDGHIYSNGVPLLNKLESAPIAVLMFAPIESTQRGDLLGDQETLAKLLRNRIIPWAEEQAKALDKDWPKEPKSFTIAGGSLGGYAAAAITLHAPDIALNGNVQSAALWWPNHDYELLASWRTHSNTPDEHRRVILHEWGKYDIHLAEENAEFARVLQTLTNATVASREYHGGHDYLNWREGIRDGLEWILRTRTEKP